MSAQEPLWTDDELAYTNRRRIPADHGRPADRRTHSTDYDCRHRPIQDVPTGRYL
ncbi:hypothetical protein OG784_12950 [Streptomyces sp. NBC_01617]|uniref:hypothetical protein n=1 Tax=Streptomyces sp. NBC_01617 TaxID=2975899 RepID=UPI003866B4D2|nr:hypothetical protein OG784_12950 [Streptomyces sp. NBC_01617]